MEASLRQVDEAEAERPLAFDRESGMLTGAGVLDRVAVLALQAGSILTRHYGHRGYRLGCKAVANLVTERDVVVRLNGDADFAFPFCDGYWSRTLNRNYDYEEEIEAFLRSASDVRYSLVDCGANFGYWSVLASSRPFGGQATLAIEASRENAKRLARNARLNGGRFRWLNAAVGEASGGFARITGARHEAFGTLALAENEPEAVPIVSLDGLAADGLIDAALPVVIKLDVEGVEIEALAGAAKLLRRDCVVICEEHGLDRSMASHATSSTNCPCMFSCSIPNCAISSDWMAANASTGSRSTRGSATTSSLPPAHRGKSGCSRQPGGVDDCFVAACRFAASGGLARVSIRNSRDGGSSPPVRGDVIARKCRRCDERSVML